MSFDADEVYQKGLEARFYFLEGRKKGICPECKEQKLIIPRFKMCLECLATKKGWNEADNGNIQKKYVRSLLNNGRITKDALTVDVIAELWEDIKSDYFRKYVEEFIDDENGHNI